jgi:glycosyltransferase involved in cell wall biosynthesis
MRIGIDISRIAATARTGTEQYTYELLAALGRRDPRNAYTLYTNRLPATLPPLRPNFALRRIPLARLWTHLRLSAEVALHPPDTLFIPAHVIPLGARLARNTRLVVTIHDLGYLHVPEAHTRAQRLQLRITTAWSTHIAAAVIAISQATKADLVRLAGIPAEKITVVHHGVSPRFAQSQPTDIRRNGPLLAHLGQNPYFLYVGTIQPRKNLVRLIEAFALATQADPRWHLVLVGKQGWLSGPIMQRINELGLTQRVIITGYLPDAEIPALLAGATAFVFPSLYEGFGMPVLEAMAAGIPVLTSNSSALPEVAGDAAILVDPLDTQAIAAGIQRLAHDADLRALLRERGLARAALFTWDRCADQTLRVLIS